MSSSRWLNSIKQLLQSRGVISKNKKRFIGEDHLGNKYYEITKPNHPWRKHQRFFQTEGINYQDPSAVADKCDVPPAWDAWLRFRRSDPPTVEEINESEEYFKFQQSLDAEKKMSEKNVKDDTIYKNHTLDKKKVPKRHR